MTEEQFIHWLEGYLDGKESEQTPTLNKIREKIKTIKSHSFNSLPNAVLQPNGTGQTWYVNTTANPKTDSNPTTNTRQLLTENED